MPVWMGNALSRFAMAGGGGASDVYYSKVLRAGGSSLIGYWPLSEASGAPALDISGNNRNGAHSGDTLGQTGIGDGNTCPSFDGANGLVSIYSAGFNSAFNGQVGSVLIWGKVAAEADWSDANFKNLLRLQVDANNYLVVGLDSTQPGYLQFYYKAGGTVKVINHQMLGGLEWFSVVATWSLATDELRLYIDGVPQGQDWVTKGLGTWAGSLSATACTIGNQNTTPGAACWHGNLAHVAIWNTVLNAAQAAQVGVWPTWLQTSPTWGSTPDWSDEFNTGSVPDPTYWTPRNDTALCQEAYFLARNVTVAGGKMIITTQAEAKGGKSYTSGYVDTLGKVQFTYGRFEISCKLPKTQGFWPGIWLLPVQSYFHENWAPLGGYYGGWPLSGEIDVIELLGHTPARAYPGLHTGNPHLSSPTPYYDLPSGDFADGQHIFVLEILPHSLKWFIDGVKVREHNTWVTTAANYPAPYDQPFYFIFTSALGGTWPGATDGTTVFPQTYEVDYIRYYKYNTAPVVSVPATTYRDKVMALSPVGYWPLWDVPDLWSNEWIYDQTANGLSPAGQKNMALGETGIGDGRTSIKGNGTTSSVLLYSTALNSVFNGQEGSVSIWGKVASSGIWTGATYERLFQFRVDDNNKVSVLRWGGANNQLIVEYKAGGTTKAVYPTVGPTTGWFNLIITWSKSGDALKFYLNGTQNGGTQTGLGTWAGNLDNWSTCIGSSSYDPYDVWNGWMAHLAVWDKPLSQAEVTTIASV
jgi:beta-glucanase (GH16 family)